MPEASLRAFRIKTMKKCHEIIPINIGKHKSRSHLFTAAILKSQSLPGVE